MKNELLFYEKDDFYDYKELKYSEGFSIISISKYIKDNDLISALDPLAEIVDISALSEFISIQLLGEQILSLFDEETIFIADIKRKEVLTYELRLFFECFGNVENNYLKMEVVTDGDKMVTTPKDKKHKKITDLDEVEIKIFIDNFKDKLYGHAKFKDDFEELIKEFRLFNKIGESKILSLFLMGESGVGKTEVAKAIYSCLNGTKKLAKVNFGNYSNEFSLSSLIGSARGYTGSDDGEIFIRIRNTDVGVLLIDEFEKSNATLFNYFLDVLESGKIISSLADEIDLDGFIIVFTSNISKENFYKRISPELRSRFDYKSLFTVLNRNDKVKYVEFRLNDLSKKVKIEFDIELPENLIDYFMKEIDVSKFNNMRDINKNIKKSFVKYIEKSQLQNEIIITNPSTISIREKLKNIF
ncbi:MAG: AAA family ATPase [Lutibacter sp.]